MTYEEIIQFHGHECPGIAMGYRMATAAINKLDSIRAEDEEIVAIVENDACGVDALQCVTGCTFGKGNLIFRDYGKHVFTIYCRSSRSGVRVHFHGDGIPEELREDRSALTKWIMSASRDSILSIEPTSIPEPEPAKIRKSIPCSFCGENVMESRINQLGGKPTCIPCFEKYIETEVRSIMFETLVSINERPKPFEYYTIESLWNDEHTSEQMLKYHLNPEIDLSSRNTDFIDCSVEWIVSRFNVGRGTQIADFGCGPGLYTSMLAQKHASVTGIDISKRSIRYAQNMAEEDGHKIQYVNQNYLEYETEDRYDLIIMIMCDFCALGPQQRKVLLSKFSNLLRPGGAVLLDVYSLEAFAGRKEQAVYEANLLDGFWSPNKYYGFLNTFKYEEEKVVLDKYTIIEPTRTWTVYNWLQYFTIDSLKKKFEENGLKIEEYYSNVAGKEFRQESLEFAIVARKNQYEESIRLTG